MIAGYEYHPGAAFGMPQDAADHVGMALFPSPFVALDLPSVYDVTHEVQGVAGVVLEEIVQGFGFAVSGAEMHVRNEDTSIGMRHHNIYLDAADRYRQL